MINVAVYGYGNIGKGIESEVAKNNDINLVAIFTRRNPAEIGVRTDVEVLPADTILDYKKRNAGNRDKEIDVLIICGGSANDLPEMTPRLARDFNCIDSFDTHADIPKHFAAVDASAKEGDHLSIISSGWDPGFFSINRVYAEAIMPHGKDYTFWGKGVSQGHSNAIRRIPGVADARQYTIPVDAAMDKVRTCCLPELTNRQKHTRECFVVTESGADKAAIEKQIVEMPNYFDEYDTTVHFITQEELDRDHSGLPHGGFVIRTGVTGFGVQDANEMCKVSGGDSVCAKSESAGEACSVPGGDGAVAKCDGDHDDSAEKLCAIPGCEGAGTKSECVGNDNTDINSNSNSAVHNHIIEYKLQLDSNPEFTASSMLAFTRALWKMYKRGERGCRTVLDIAPGDMSPRSPEELRASLL